MQREELFRLIKKVGKKAGREVLVKALTLWFCMIDTQTPLRIKALIFGDLVYFISPLDAVPDPIPGVGFSDDFGVLAATLTLIALHIRKEHHDSAKKTVDEWLGPKE